MTTIKQASTTAGKDDTIKAVGLPARDRYNFLVAATLDQLKTGGNPAKAQVLATLALAEATFLGGAQ